MHCSNAVVLGLFAGLPPLAMPCVVCVFYSPELWAGPLRSERAQGLLTLTHSANKAQADDGLALVCLSVVCWSRAF